MSKASPLLSHLHDTFRAALGEPSSMLELDSQWSLRADPRAPAIFVLVNGSYEKPAVWIFDPFAAENVWRTSITSKEEVNAALELINKRTASAAAAWAQT